MKIPALKADTLPNTIRAMLASSNALLEVTESRSNGRTLRDLRVVFGDFDLNALTDQERARLVESHEAGLYCAEADPETPEPTGPVILSRKQFEALDAAGRAEHLRGGGALVD